MSKGASMAPHYGRHRVARHEASLSVHRFADTTMIAPRRALHQGHPWRPSPRTQGPVRAGPDFKSTPDCSCLDP